MVLCDVPWIDRCPFDRGLELSDDSEGGVEEASSMIELQPTTHGENEQ